MGDSSGVRETLGKSQSKMMGERSGERLDKKPGRSYGWEVG